MKKQSNKSKSIFDIKVKLTVDEKLSKLDLKSQAPKQLAEANKRLKKIKSLPK